MFNTTPKHRWNGPGSGRMHCWLALWSVLLALFGYPAIAQHHIRYCPPYPTYDADSTMWDKKLLVLAKNVEATAKPIWGYLYRREFGVSPAPSILSRAVHEAYGELRQSMDLDGIIPEFPLCPCPSPWWLCPEPFYHTYRAPSMFKHWVILAVQVAARKQNLTPLSPLAMSRIMAYFFSATSYYLPHPITGQENPTDPQELGGPVRVSTGMELEATVPFHYVARSYNSGSMPIAGPYMFRIPLSPSWDLATMYIEELSFNGYSEYVSKKLMEIGARTKVATLGGVEVWLSTIGTELVCEFIGALGGGKEAFISFFVSPTDSMTPENMYMSSVIVLYDAGMSTGDTEPWPHYLSP